MESMSDKEFDLLDELYFVQSFSEIKEALGWADELLIENLFILNQKGFIKALKAQDSEYTADTTKIQNVPWKELYFLATKKGLLEHNGF